MKKKTWKTGIDLSTRKKRKKIAMFIKRRYLCSNTKDYCKKQMFFCPERFTCKWHYLAKRKAWYNNPVNKKRLLARLRQIMSPEDAQKRLEAILSRENEELDIELTLLSNPKYSSCHVKPRNKK